MSDDISSLRIFNQRAKLDLPIEYDFNKAMQAINYFGPECMPPGKHDKFSLSGERKEIYTQLIYYFFNDKKFNGDLNCGIFINGGKGTGKTIMMKIFKKMAENKLLPKHKSFNMAICKKIVRDYESDGVTALGDYWDGNYCFDDLGGENKKALHFGTIRNVMEEIISARYDEWVDKGQLTFLTSNYSLKIILEEYGIRAEDRFREMFNIISLDGESLRRKK